MKKKQRRGEGKIGEEERKGEKRDPCENKTKRSDLVDYSVSKQTRAGPASAAPHAAAVA